MPAAAVQYVFGPFRLDASERLLLRDSEPVPLTSKAFELLAVLLEHSGHLVDKQELLRRVWPDAFVEEAVLSVNIAAIRRALGDDAHQYIETVPKCGYRFVGDVQTVETAETQPARSVAPTEAPPAVARVIAANRKKRLPWIVLTATLVVGALSLQVGWQALTRPRIGNSVAVLPLKSLSDNPEQQHFADAMTDLLLTNLGRIPQLRVVSLQSVMQYQGTHKTLPQIARELKVDCIVEGTVHREGDRVRITAQLIHGPTDRHLWAASYERDLSGAFAVQDDVAESIAREIGIKLAPAQRRREAPPVSAAAHEAFLRGMSFLDEGADAKAIEEFRKTVAIDPNYALAYTKMASAYFGRAFFGFMPPNEAFPAMKEAALHAIEKDGGDAEAHAWLANEKLHYEWDWPGAEREFRRSLELNPSDSEVRHIYAHYLLTVGRWQESLAQMDRAFETDPVGIGTAT
jgi:TolB-like protein/DNA-binding winged helix-turn-helix (wHTH) protein